MGDLLADGGRCAGCSSGHRGETRDPDAAGAGQHRADCSRGLELTGRDWPEQGTKFWIFKESQLPPERLGRKEALQQAVQQRERPQLRALYPSHPALGRFPQRRENPGIRKTNGTQCWVCQGTRHWASDSRVEVGTGWEGWLPL